MSGLVKMNAFTKLKMFKASRLTRQVQLKKSLSLLRSMLDNSAIITQKWKDLRGLAEDKIKKSSEKTTSKAKPKTSILRF
jgi:hypothetical protein